MFETTLRASLFSALMLAVVYWPLERLWPARKQAWLRPRLGTDALFMFGQHLVWGVLALAVLSAVDGLLRGALPLPVRAGFMDLPRWAQLLSIVLLGDGAVYWFHRACHRFEFLWRFHAVHHSSETLDWVASHREHPVDGLLTQLTVNLPAILLGFPVEGLAALVVFRGLWATFIHSNVRLPLGPLKYVLGAPELHHWHHAKHPGVVANYGNLSPWTDLLFGTFHQPPAGEETWALGVPEALPSSWLGLLLAPFSPAWAQRPTLLTARVLSPLALGLLVAVVFGTSSFAQSDSGASADLERLFRSEAYLPATKAFGPGGLGLGVSPLAGLKELDGGLVHDSAPEPGGVFSVSGALPEGTAREVLAAHVWAFKQCQVSARDEHQGQDGGRSVPLVEVKLVVEATGVLRGWTIVGAAQPSYQRCLDSELKTVRFPKLKAGVATVWYRIN